MKYTNTALKEKVRELYPDIEKYKVSVALTYNREKNAYVLRFKRGKQEMITHIEKGDADDCMSNIRCLHLGIKVDAFIRSFAAREELGRKVA